MLFFLFNCIPILKHGLLHLLLLDLAHFLISKKHFHLLILLHLIQRIQKQFLNLIKIYLFTFNRLQLLILKILFPRLAYFKGLFHCTLPRLDLGIIIVIVTLFGIQQAFQSGIPKFVLFLFSCNPKLFIVIAGFFWRVLGFIGDICALGHYHPISFIKFSWIGNTPSIASLLLKLLKVLMLQNSIGIRPSIWIKN